MTSGAQEFNELYHSIGQAERSALKFAQEQLMFATVSVNIKDCDYPFNDLPVELQRPLHTIGRPAKKVTSMDMQLGYDRGDMMFVPNEVGLKLDSSYTFLFSRIKEIASKVPGVNTLQGVFYPQVITPQGQPLFKPSNTGLMPGKLLGELLEELGVGIPAAPQRAEWSAIYSTLQFSNRWSAVAASQVQVDSRTALHVEERSDGRGYTGDDEIDDDATDEVLPHISEVVVAHERSKRAGAVATKALKFMMTSDEPSEAPRFSNMLRVPVYYEPVFLGGDQNIRYEDAQKAEIVIPTLEIMKTINDALELASKKEA
jgi:hypothetical protein